MSLLTNKEKQTVTRMIAQKPGGLQTFVNYYGYIVPSLGMAIYSLIVQDFIASLVAYIMLFAIVIFYLIYTERYSKDLRSALKKYESEVKAL